jgi:hypothetical protein
VKGLARHLELKELKKKQEDEKRLREAEVFGLHHKFAPNVSDLDISRVHRLNTSITTGAATPYAPTIPEPFALTNAGKLDERRRQILLKELKEKEMTECTFKPKIDGVTNKKIIKDMLNQIDNNNNNHNHYHANNDISNLQYHNVRYPSNDEKENRFVHHYQHNFPLNMMTSD